MDGMATTALKYVEEYLDAQIRSICVGLPENVTYQGYERCTPQEAYEEITRVRNSRRIYDLAPSTVFLVKYFFGFKDAEQKEHVITHHLFLPFCEDAGIITTSGVKHHIVPVLTDKVFTPGRESIFVRLTQDRNNMHRINHTVVFNGVKEAKHLVWAIIYRNRSKANRSQRTSTTRMKTALVHYLLAKYGFTGAFQRYAGSVPVIGGEEITELTHPPSEWMVCRSTGQLPVGSCFDKPYIPTKITLAVRHQDWNESMESLITGFFYVVDHFPRRFKPDISYLDDRSLWMILIGHALFSSDQGENLLLNNVQEHFETIDPYLDMDVKQKLENKGILLENYYDLLHYLQVNFKRMICANEAEGLSVYGKSLEVLYYVLYETICSFTRAKFELNKIANKIKGTRSLTLNDVQIALRQIRPGSIFRITKQKIVTQPVNSSSDHKYPKITAVTAEQESQAGTSRNKQDRVVVSARHHLDLSMIDVGSVLNLPKSTPVPTSRINPWVMIDSASGTVVPNPKFKEVFEKTRELMKL